MGAAFGGAVLSSRRPGLNPSRRAEEAASTSVPARPPVKPCQGQRVVNYRSAVFRPAALAARTLPTPRQAVRGPCPHRRHPTRTAGAGQRADQPTDQRRARAAAVRRVPRLRPRAVRRAGRRSHARNRPRGTRHRGRAPALLRRTQSTRPRQRPPRRARQRLQKIRRRAVAPDDHARPTDKACQAHLERLNQTRNAIAHSDEGELAKLRRDGIRITMATARTWRRALDQLAVSMDAILDDYFTAAFGGQRPWKG